MIPGFSTRLEWERGWKSCITEKTEDPKNNKGNLTIPPHTVNVIELNCKVGGGGEGVSTAPTIKPLTEVLYIWMKAFLVGFISVIPIYCFWIFYWYYT